MLNTVPFMDGVEYRDWRLKAFNAILRAAGRCVEKKLGAKRGNERGKKKYGLADPTASFSNVWHSVQFLGE